MRQALSKVERAKDNRIGSCRTGWSRTASAQLIAETAQARPAGRGRSAREPVRRQRALPALSCFCFWLFGGLARLGRAAAVN